MAGDRWSGDEQTAIEEFETAYREAADRRDVLLVAAAINLAGVRIANALERVAYELDQLRGA